MTTTVRVGEDDVVVCEFPDLLAPEKRILANYRRMIWIAEDSEDWVEMYRYVLKAADLLTEDATIDAALLDEMLPGDVMTIVDAAVEDHDVSWGRYE